MPSSHTTYPKFVKFPRLSATLQVLWRHSFAPPADRSSNLGALFNEHRQHQRRDIEKHNNCIQQANNRTFRWRYKKWILVSLRPGLLNSGAGRTSTCAPSSCSCIEYSECTSNLARGPHLLRPYYDILEYSKDLLY